MKQPGAFYFFLSRKGKVGFTLIEILVVMTIIGILMALVIGVAGPVQWQARMYRARGEVAAVETALTRFETDNGFIPISDTIGINGGAYYSGDNSGTSTAYQESARKLFLAITGRSFFAATDNMGEDYFKSLKGGQTSYNPSGSTPVNTGDKPSNAYDTYTTKTFTGAKDGDYLKDPWGSAYGYYYSATTPGHSIYNQVTYDLWSTGATDNPTAATDAIIKRWAANWPNQ